MPTEPPDSAPRIHYGNFSDPRGLIFRMLRTGNRAAYAGLLRELAKKFVAPFDWMISKFAAEPSVNSAEPTGSPHPIILIVGPPRSGSTLVYQIIARYCDVTYPNNLNSLFPRSSLFALKWLSRRTPSKTPAIKSCYGQTSRLSDPNEGFYIWDRWLGTDRYSTVEMLSSQTAREMNGFFAAWTSEVNKPFVNKNNRSTACINLLSSCLKNSYFVVVQRDDRDIVRSIIRGREFVQGDKRRPWGLDSQNTHVDEDPLGYIDDVCEQVRRISETINGQIELVDNDRVIDIPYEAFCRAPHETLQRVVQNIPDLKLRDDLIANELKPFRVSTGNLLSAEEEARMDRCLGELT